MFYLSGFDTAEKSKRYLSILLRWIFTYKYKRCVSVYVRVHSPFMLFVCGLVRVLACAHRSARSADVRARALSRVLSAPPFSWGHVRGCWGRSEKGNERLSYLTAGSLVV